MQTARVFLTSGQLKSAEERSGNKRGGEKKSGGGGAMMIPPRLVALDDHGLIAAGRDPEGDTTTRQRITPRSEMAGAKSDGGPAHLLPSRMALSAVLPSRLTNRRRLLSVWVRGEMLHVSLAQKKVPSWRQTPGIPSACSCLLETREYNVSSDAIILRHLSII